jgi:2-desacetyl-2-hydroxyethyl bacteriochlorophyllide A dehydrogenase
MKALQITAAGKIQIADLRMPDIGPDDVLIRSRAVGICGSDIELYQGTRPEGFYRYPVIPGHEWAGEIAKVGEHVHTFTPGQKVVAEGFLFCGACQNCLDGQTNLCEAGYDEIGFTRPGGLAEYVVVPARQVHALSEYTSLEEAALLEPAAVVAHAFLRAKPSLASSVAVIGDGTIGLLAVQFARLFKPQTLILLGSRPERLALAQRLGATHTINTQESDPLPLIETISRGRGIDYVFEGGSRPQGVETALSIVRRGGIVLLEGIAGAEARLSLESDLFVLKHLAVLGVFGANSAAWTYAVQMFSAGSLNLAPLITHRFALTNYRDAFDTVLDRQKKAIKVLLVHDEKK